MNNSHFDGPLINNTRVTEQFKILNYKQVFLDCTNQRNNCIFFKDGSIAIILNIVKYEKNDIHLIEKKCIPQGDLYEIPCNSSNYNIPEILENESDALVSWPLSEIEAKFWKVPIRSRKAIVFPLLHTVST